MPWRTDILMAAAAVFMTVASLLLPVDAQSPLAQRPIATSSICGKLVRVDAEGHRAPIQKEDLALYALASEQAACPGNSNLLEKAATDSHGKFAFRAHKPGQYCVKAGNEKDWSYFRFEIKKGQDGNCSDKTLMLDEHGNPSYEVMVTVD